MLNENTVSAVATETATPATGVSRYASLKPGMVVRVHEIIKDVNAKGEERERAQVFEGTIIGFKSSDVSRSITVRKVSGGVGVEKIYPLASPHVAKVEVVKEQRVRRAKLYFLRADGEKKRPMKEVLKAKVKTKKAAKSK